MEFNAMDIAFHKNGEFHHVSVNKGHTASAVDDMLCRFDGAGWEITSVIVWDGDGQTETVDTILPLDWQVSELFWELDNHPFMCEKAVAFLLAFGWGEWNENEYFERCFGEFDNPEQFAIENTSIYAYEGGKIDIPEWVEVDWTATARRLQADYAWTLQRHNGSVFAFRNFS
jgi:hypothetical protein